MKDKIIFEKNKLRNDLNEYHLLIQLLLNLNLLNFNFL